MGNEPLEDSDTVPAAHAVCNLRSVFLVMHEEKVKFPDVVDQELFETVGKDVAGLFVAAIANL